MSDIKRRPQTVYEDRLDFVAIERAQEARHEALLRDLRKLLFEIQRRTLAWVVTNLVRKRLKTAVVNFALPLKSRWRTLLRLRIIAAAKTGKADVATELGIATPVFKQPELSRLRVRADVLFQDQTSKLESELKRVWSQAMFGKIDEAQLVYLTKKTFANFAGWPEPEAP